MCQVTVMFPRSSDRNCLDIRLHVSSPKSTVNNTFLKQCAWSWARRAHLVHVHQLGMWEVERGNEQAHTFTLHSVPVQVVRNKPGHKVLASPRPAMEGQSQGLVWIRVANEALYCFQNNRLGQVLPMKLLLKIPRQS